MEKENKDLEPGRWLTAEDFTVNSIAPISVPYFSYI